MHYWILIVAPFLLGMGIELGRIVDMRKKEFWQRFLLSLCLLALLVGKILYEVRDLVEFEQILPTILFSWLVGLAVLLKNLLREHTHPIVTEKTVLLMGTLFWYQIFDTATSLWPLSLVPLLISGVFVYAILDTRPLSPIVKTVVYLSLVGILLYLTSHALLPLISKPELFPTIVDSLIAFTSGTVSVYAFSYLTSLLEMLPQKNERWRDAKKRIGEHAEFLSGRLADTQHRALDLLGSAAAVILILAINAHTGLVPPSIVANSIIVWAMRQKN